MTNEVARAIAGVWGYHSVMPPVGLVGEAPCSNVESIKIIKGAILRSGFDYVTF